MALLADEAVDIGTVAAEITRAEERDDPSVVKVVGSPVGGGACAPSTSPAPPRLFGEGPLYHHIGLYAYRRRALERFVAACRRPPLEKRERLEQLRALGPACVSTSPSSSRRRSASIRPEDLARARAMLSKHS